MFGAFKGKVKDCHLQDPEQIVRAFQELWDNRIFEELQSILESHPDRLRWIIEYDEEYFRKWHSYKSGISWISKFGLRPHYFSAVLWHDPECFECCFIGRCRMIICNSLRFQISQLDAFACGKLPILDSSISRSILPIPMLSLPCEP
jgi:hypothetical protein